MTYSLQLHRDAIKALRSLPLADRQRIAEQIDALGHDPRPQGCLKLTDDRRQGWRVRVGRFRILYQIDDEAKQVFIYTIEPRDTAYSGR